MKTKAIATCYACDQAATTKEHVPPFSFFPVGYRKNLITVSSCVLHNNLNATDVEYTQNIVSTFFGINDVGERHFLNKAMKSFGHTPALLHTTFSDIRPVKIQGLEVGAFIADVKRIKAVMNACITALHFLETGEKNQQWEIVLPNMSFANDATGEEVGAWRQFLSLFTQMPFHLRATDSPEVFQYAVADIDGGRVYSMRFYKGFLAFGFRAVEASPLETQPE